MLPSVTGRRFLSRKAFQVTAAPERMPSGTMNILATECSRPSAMKAEIGNQMATILPGKSLAIDAMYTAMHTSQLQRMPRTKACLKLSDVLATAVATGAPDAARVPPAATSAARPTEPRKLPAYETSHDFASWPPSALPSATAVVTIAVLPVKSSAPESSVIISPKGRPNAPSTSLWRPGLDSASPGQAPPTVSISSAPKPMCTPEKTPSRNTLSAGIAAFLLPAATAPSKPSGGVARTLPPRRRWRRVSAAGCGTTVRAPEVAAAAAMRSARSDDIKLGVTSALEL
mmetsp:Transcript_13230/g.39547  ORF Transcript_13230/g.39547 Transcript_13230/m.39547 type:complete len:287 (-) Transcript_13230:10-870(-)